jgi:hypothetical protein
MVTLALLAGLFRQGAFEPGVQLFVAALLAAAFVVALATGQIKDVPWTPIVAAGLLAGWAVIDGIIHGSVQGGAGYVLLLLGLCVALLVGRSANDVGRDVIFHGLLGVGLLVAMNGWLGVVLHAEPAAMVSQQLWRASSFLTYPNATAVVLAVLSLLVLAELTTETGSVALSLTAASLLVGAGATGSRAGLLGLGGGFALLACLRGVRRTVRVTLPPALGAMIGLAGLVPSIPVAGTPRPYLAAGTLVVGLAVAAGLPRLPGWIRGRVLAGTLAAGVVVALVVVFSVRERAAQALLQARANLSSPDRVGAWRAAWRQIQSSPLGGSGPGRLHLGWIRSDGAQATILFVHNEYLQVSAELGLVGLATLLIALVSVAWFLYRSRDSATPTLWAGAVAGAAALAIHAGFDFVWHLPVIPLMVVVLMGLASAGHPQTEARVQEEAPLLASVN